MLLQSITITKFSIECIPVGCVPTAIVAPLDVSIGEESASGGKGLPTGGLSYPPPTPLVERQTPLKHYLPLRSVNICYATNELNALILTEITSFGAEYVRARVKGAATSNMQLSELFLILISHLLCFVLTNLPLRNVSLCSFDDFNNISLMVLMSPCWIALYHH